MHDLVVIIDDDPISILVCETILKKNEFAREIKTFASGEKAMDYFETEIPQGRIPSHLFLDVLMPGMDGWGFLEKFKPLLDEVQDQPEIIMLSASFDPDEKARAEANPLVSKFISKPITREVLSELNQTT